jgi:hypothetical protein
VTWSVSLGKLQKSEKDRELSARQTQYENILTLVFSALKLRKPQKTKRLISQLDTNLHKRMKLVRFRRRSRSNYY